MVPSQPGQRLANSAAAEHPLPKGTIRLLLVEDNPDDAELFQAILAKAPRGQFELTHVIRLSEARARLARRQVDVVLLDLSLPDSAGLATIESAHASAPEVPIVVLTGLKEESLGVEAILMGAQYYVLKNELNPSLLLRAIRYAIGPERIHEELRSLALRDELTGLLNLRGFAILAEQQLKLARRARRGLLLAYFDTDGLKSINDTLGHQEGSRALVETADILRGSLRSSDIIGRLGGDEFAALILEAGQGSGELLERRVRSRLAAGNARSDRAYPLSISMGTAAYDPQDPCSLHELLARADKRMYEAKRKAIRNQPLVSRSAGTE